MKFLLLLPALALAAQAQSNPAYREICPSLDGTSKTLSDGYTFTYVCGKAGSVSARYGTIQDVTNADDCAAACQGSDRCQGSSWYSVLKRCYLYDSNEAGPSVWDTVFLRTDARGSDGGAGPGPELEQCNEDLTQCQAQLAETTAALTNATSAPDYYRPATEICLRSTREKVTYGGVSYQANCNKIRMTQPVDKVLTTDLGSCGKLCSEANCPGFEYHLREEDQCLILSQQIGDFLTGGTYYFVITMDPVKA